MLKKWIREDTEFFNSIDATVYYMKCQISEYLEALAEKGANGNRKRGRRLWSFSLQFTAQPAIINQLNFL